MNSYEPTSATGKGIPHWPDTPGWVTVPVLNSEYRYGHVSPAETHNFSTCNSDTGPPRLTAIPHQCQHSALNSPYAARLSRPRACVASFPNGKDCRAGPSVAGKTSVALIS